MVRNEPHELVITEVVVVVSELAPVHKYPFRCYSCLEKRKPKEFGIEILHQYVCRECLPYVDEVIIGSLIRFDRKHGFPVRGD